MSIPLLADVDPEAIAVLKELQRAVQHGDGVLALTVCESIDRMTKCGEYLALGRIDWGDDKPKRRGR